MKESIQEIVDRLSVSERTTGPIHSHGALHQRDRLREVCELTLQTYSGDILEIGCHVGLTTVIFCKLAQKYGRKVFIIDPWNGEQEGNENVYQQFVNNTKDYSHILSVNRMTSQSLNAKNIIHNNNFCFCWIDGLHTPGACSQDIDTCIQQDQCILAVDDLKWLPELHSVFDDKAEQFRCESVYNPNCREGYILNL